MSAIVASACSKLHQGLAALLVLAVTGCQSADPISLAPVPKSGMLGPSACQKADSLWNDRILPSRHAQLPPLASPAIFDLLKLATSGF